MLFRSFVYLLSCSGGIFSPSAVNASLPLPHSLQRRCGLDRAPPAMTCQIARASRTVIILRRWRMESAQDDRPSVRFGRTDIFRSGMRSSLGCSAYPIHTRITRRDSIRSDSSSSRPRARARARAINVEVHLYGEEKEQRHAVLGTSVCCASLIFHTLENGRIMGSGGVREFDSLSRYSNAQLAL